MKKEKFYIQTNNGEKQVDGWTYKGLGYFKIKDKNYKYSITHLQSGLSLHYANLKIEAETFIKTLADNMNCKLEREVFMDSFFRNKQIYELAKLSATEVTK